jgi:tetratricopeptide (TPR) repeat protein
VRLALGKFWLHPEQLVQSPPIWPSWRWQVLHVQPDFLLAEARKQLNAPQLPAKAHCHALDLFVTAVLMYGRTEFLAEANEYSKELIEANPDEWTVKGTRGSILIDLGDIEAGMAMLGEVMEKDPSPFDRAIGASFLALGELKRNNRAVAQEWLRTARALDPNCGALVRVEAMLRFAEVESSLHPPAR